MCERRPPPSPRGSRIAALLAFTAVATLFTAPAIAKRPSVTRNRGFSAEEARVHGARKNKKRRKGKKPRKKRAGRWKKAAAPKDGPVCTIGTDDLFRQRIDARARTSLMRKMSGSEAMRAEASSIYHALEDGTLAGISSASTQQQQSTRSQRPLLPPGTLSACLTRTDGKPPTILVREKLSKGQLDAALSSAWKACGLPTTHVCSYDSPLKKPPSKAPPRAAPKT